MIRRILETLVYVSAVVAGVLAVVAVTPSTIERDSVAAPPQESSAICVPAGRKGLLLSANASRMVIPGQSEQQLEPAASEELDAPVVIRGEGGLVAGVSSAADKMLGWVPCTTAGTSGALVLPNSSDATLLLVNPDTADASVDLRLLTTSGEVDALGARGIAVGAGQTREVALSVLGRTDDALGVMFETTRGRVGVAARVAGPASLEGLVTARPATTHLLPGVPDGATTVRVLVANPGAERVSVEIRALGTTPDYTPAGATGVTVEPGATTTITLDGLLAGEPSALMVKADQEVVASLQVGAPDPALVAPVEPATELQTLVPAGGTVLLTAPEQEARVSLTSAGATQELVVPAGSTVSLPDPGEGVHLVGLTSDQPVAAAIAWSGPGGSATVALQSPTGTSLPPLPAQIDPHLN